MCGDCPNPARAQQMIELRRKLIERMAEKNPAAFAPNEDGKLSLSWKDLGGDAVFSTPKLRRVAEDPLDFADEEFWNSIDFAEFDKLCSQPHSGNKIAVSNQSEVADDTDS